VTRTTRTPKAEGTAQAKAQAQAQATPASPEPFGDVMVHWDATLDAAEWVTLPEAAAAAGVSVSALRTWYRRGDVAAELAAGPHGQQRLVRLEDVLERAARSRPAVDRSGADDATASRGDTGAGAAITLLAQQLERTEDRAERAEAALREVIARAAAAEAERDLLRRLLEQRD
jgi:hypothetical protein